MKKNKKSKYSNLHALFDSDVVEQINSIEEQIKKDPSTVKTNEVPITNIVPNPYQPRVFFDEEKIDELATSIKNYGIFSPLILKKSAGTDYYIIAGERRFRAAKKAGLTSVPAVLVDFDDSQMMEIALLENIQREDLNAVEEAKAYQQIQKHSNLTQDQLASKFGKSRSYITNVMRILNMPLKIQEYVEQGKLTIGHVKPIMGLKNENLILKIADRAIDEKLSVRSVEHIVNGYNLANYPRKKTNKDEAPSKDLRYATSLLRKKVHAKVAITNNKIIIDFKTINDLNNILEKLGVIEKEWD